MRTKAPDAYTRAAEMRDRGALPESVNALTSGALASPKIGTGYDSERAAIHPDGRIQPEDVWAAFDAYPSDDVRRELFREGWSSALHGFRDPAYMGRAKASACELVRCEGWDAYRAARGIVEEPDGFGIGEVEVQQDERDHERRKLMGER